MYEEKENKRSIAVVDLFKYSGVLESQRFTMRCKLEHFSHFLFCTKAQLIIPVRAISCLTNAFRCSDVGHNFVIAEMGKTALSDESHVELENRDPRHLNQHLQVIWEEVIGEPGGIRSPECAWCLSIQCFRISRGCCYTLLSIFVAPLFALCLGLSFACLAFEHIWCIAPCLRIWRINCFAAKNFWNSFVQTVVHPCTESCGYLFYNIRILNQKLPNTLERKADLHIV
ncbi:caveolin-3-like [Phymastichus coffea]|uniref:caveolin-3-like n=1 Tax=Phymastichus coffea TaxID=108790 RepID=UPI00273CA57D|nr:caveolin-3-like [Phymastichus coffea]